MKAKEHPQQTERLAVLKSYDILDTPREADFDDIVQLAAKICDVPIALISLVGGERQWFKAEVGLGKSETPIENSICAHAILGEESIIIEDTHKDPRTIGNALCAPLDGLRFYAGVQLKADNGLPIGTLCVLDNKPNTLNEDQQQALKVLGRRVMRELDLRRSLNAQSVLRDEMDHRVKNSLTSMAGAIRLYKREASKSGNVDGAFDALQRQLDAVSAVHRAIYLSKESDSVDLQEYITDLSAHLEISLPANVVVTSNAPQVEVPPKIASTIGLIANEFAANTIKHGHIPDDAVNINYEIVTLPGELTLTCTNNVPERAAGDQPRAPGIGARLMRASISQFGGTVLEQGGSDGFQLTANVFFV